MGGFIFRHQTDEGEIERWISSWGEHARLLEPFALKRQIRRVAEAILAAL